MNVLMGFMSDMYYIYLAVTIEDETCAKLHRIIILT